jgi:cell division protease FtsH
MRDDETPDSKKQFPSGFIFLLILSLLTVLFIQGLMETRIAKVNFSYQLEHLVNLNLIRSEESRKTSLNDNLVTFSGVFRDNLTPESKERYKYLELLESRYSLQTKKATLNNELAADRQKVIQAANWYVNLAGISIPPEGYVIVDTNYDTADQNNAIIIDRVQTLQVESIGSIKRALASVNAADSRSFAEQLLAFVRNMRSPLLGIGDEPMKQRLKEIETTLQQGIEQNKLATVNYSTLVNELDGMITTLGTSQDGIRLQQLRSVREYKAGGTELLLLVKEQDDVEVSLNKAREAVASVIWFFNNKELSTRQLEKQDPEIYNQWFQGAKHEWEQFPANRGSYFKAPDQPSNLVLERRFKSEQPPSNYLIYLFNFLPVLLVIGVLYFLFARQMKGMGAGGAMNFGKSPAKLLQKGQHKVTRRWKSYRRS